MRRMSGFSLMEMMIVLLIVAIVAAASAPMINKKMLTNASSESPWVWTGLSNNIAYNLGGKEQTAVIGAITPNNNYVPRLHIQSNRDSSSSSTQNLFPQISISADGQSTPIHIAVDKNNAIRFASPATLWTNESKANSITIGNKAEASAEDAIAMGYGSQASGVKSVNFGSTYSSGSTTQYPVAGNYCIAIGSAARASSVSSGNPSNSQINDSIAIGTLSNAIASGVAVGKSTNAQKQSIAIGPLSEAAENAVSIGYDSGSKEEYANNSVAIGYSADAAKNSVAIGRVAWAVPGTTSENISGAIAIGDDSAARKTDSIAIGRGATCTHTHSAAIGADAKTDKNKQIVLGTSESEVYIPGTLKVNSLDLSSITGTITIGANSATVEIPGTVALGTSSGKVYIRAKDESSALRVGIKGTRDLFAVVNGDTYSDRRLKNVGEAFKGGLEELKKLELFHFTFKKDKAKTPHVGVMAQDLQKVFPDAVFKGDDGFLRIRMEDMFYALINAVKELDTKITALKEQEIFILKKQVTNLEKQNKELVKTIEKLEKRLDKLEKKKDK